MDTKNDLFFALFEHNPVQTIAVDREARIIAINKAKRESGDRLPTLGDVMYRDYAAGHRVDMYAELMQIMYTGETKVFSEMIYGEKIISIRISPFVDGAVIVSEDLTMCKNMERALRISEERFRTLLSCMPNMAVQGYDQNGCVTFWNAASCALYGYTEEEAMGRSLLDLIIPAGMRESVSSDITHMIKTGIPIPAGELLLQRKDGSYVAVYSSHSLVRINGVTEFFCVDIDLAERKAAEKALRDSEVRLRAIADAAQDAIIMMDPCGCISFWNPSAQRILGFSADDAIGCSLHDLIAPKKYHEKYHAAFSRFQKSGEGSVVGTTIDLEARCADDRIIDVQLSLSSILIDDRWHAVGILRDVTEQKNAEKELRKSEERLRMISMTDQLTQLYNRWHFSFELKREVDRSDRYDVPLSVVMFDADDFKVFNEKYGHVVGDRVLQILAHIVRNNIRKIDIACRIGGEEFFIILPMTGLHVAQTIANRIRLGLKKHVLQDAPTEKITISCGVCTYVSSESPEQLILRADQLMRMAKKNGKDRICM